jgi:hypothetical protein
MIQLSGIAVNRLALALAWAQCYADDAKFSETFRLHCIEQVREQLQNMFEILPEEIQKKILEIEGQLGKASPKPPIRKVKGAD